MKFRAKFIFNFACVCPDFVISFIEMTVFASLQKSIGCISEGLFLDSMLYIDLCVYPFTNIHFKVNLSISTKQTSKKQTKNLCWDLIRTALNLQTNLGRIYIFTIVESSNPWPWNVSPLSRSFIFLFLSSVFDIFGK